MGKKQSEAKTKKNKNSKSPSSLFERLDRWFEKRHHLIAILITLSSLILAIFMFDAKISTGLDDSTYIEQGYKYSKDFFNHFFTSQAPFYAIILAIPIAIMGINIVFLKVLSVLFFVASVYLLYRAFRFKISWLILFSSLFIYATNSEALKYASLTYTEAFYLFLQAWFVLSLLKVIEKADNKDSWGQIVKSNGIRIILMSVLFYFLFFTRTVGIAAIVAVGAFYLLRKEYKLMVVVPGFMAGAYAIFEVIKKTIWSNVDQFSSQSRILFQKDAYDASEGNEDLMGFITRLLENTNQYFSSRFYEILGFREYPSEWSMGLTLLTIVPIFIAFIIAFKRKNKVMLINILLIAAICGFTFLALQTSWGQGRYIMILLPFIFMALFYVLVQWFSGANLKSYQLVALGIMAIFVLKNLSNTTSLAKDNVPIARANLFKGDKYAGYTPDWVNFLKMSEWCGKNLPDSALVASRKAPMSFLYSNGKKFYPIWRTLPNPDPDSTLRAFKEAGVTHVMLGNLRVNSKTSQAGIINTVHRVLQPIDKKYPGSLELVHSEGEYEETRLLKINY